MDLGRRKFGVMLAAGTFLLWKQQTPAAQQNDRFRQLPRVPPEPSRETREMTRARLEENQKQIKKDVEKLLQLAQELKKQVDSTDAKAVLSLQLVRKAEEVEKLARAIKSRARGD